MTPESFLSFYPQFATFEQGVVLPLYTAHKLTLYSASCLPEGAEAPTMAQLTSAGKGSMQEIASKRVGEVSVSYATNTSLASANHTGLNDLKQTVYGLQLLSLLRVYGFARYIP